MRPARLSAILVLLLGICACEPRQPIGRTEAVSAGDSLQRREGLSWGSPEESLPPGPADADGHRWWQLRYADVGSERDRILLVDARTGWVRHPPVGYAVRMTPSSPLPQAQSATVSEGPWILLVTTPERADADARASLEREAARLDALAGQTNLYPLFSVRTDRTGAAAIVYGWQGDGGIQRDEHVCDWLAVRTPHGRGTWVDLLQ